MQASVLVRRMLEELDTPESIWNEAMVTARAEWASRSRVWLSNEQINGTWDRLSKPAQRALTRLFYQMGLF